MMATVMSTKSNDQPHENGGDPDTNYADEVKLLQEWKLEQYKSILFDNGYESFKRDWQYIENPQTLVNIGFKRGHADRFVGAVKRKLKNPSRPTFDSVKSFI